jgi:hypothetical protein
MTTPTQIQLAGNVTPLGDVTKLTFRISRFLYHSTGPEVISPSVQEVVPDASGNFTVTLYGTNDPDWNPSNWTYVFRAEGPDVTVEYNISVPFDLPSPSNFGLVLPALPASDGTLYAAFNHTHAGGGGGNLSPATSVTDETSFGVAKAVGSSANYARQDHTHGSPALGTTSTTAAAGNAPAAAVAAHAAASDPHPVYLTQTEGDARYLQPGVYARVLSLNATDPVPGGTPAGTVVVRTT